MTAKRTDATRFKNEGERRREEGRWYG